MNKCSLFKIGLLFVPIMLILITVPSHLSAQTGESCFDATGYCISGRIQQYWEQNGGLRVFGYPTTAQSEILIEGQPFQAQWFERNRLELHPENDPPYDVLLGRLGDDVLNNNPPESSSADPLPGECYRLPDAAFAVCGRFLEVWRVSGLQLDGDPNTVTEAESLALFGLPLTAPRTETLSDGNAYTVQWFERARFEYHPDQPAPYDVLFGLLGNEILGDNGTPPEPTPAPVLDWPDLSLNQGVTGLRRPTSITHAGDGSGRLFVVEQQGHIRVIDNGVLQTTPFLDIVGARLLLW
ncbi:MAG: hypothetical protein HC837_08995 [Chloroflexaceae bacterium]|nr:hypothetical protein [Chloroflexaceae bacterium]